MNTYIAVDFGASNGRVIAGSIVNGAVELQELHRFPNKPVKLGNELYWNFLSLFEEMKTGLRIAAKRGLNINGIGIDTWGVDYAYVNRCGNLASNPVSYRNVTSKRDMNMVLRHMHPSYHYKRTGIQPMPINTLFRLAGDADRRYNVPSEGDTLLFMPDLFSYFLCGSANVEYTIATTSDMFNTRLWQWEKKMMGSLGIDTNVLPPIVTPGTIRGQLTEEMARELGLPRVDVIAVASHDTASAVAALPTTDPTAAFLSSGTWSLLGAVTDRLITTLATERLGFSNEGAIDEKICFLQNITGLWILQRLMAQWQEKGDAPTYDEILPQAEASFNQSIINVDDPAFKNPDDMEAAIIRKCRDGNQPIPQTRADIVKCVLRSLALRYRQGIEQLNSVLPEPITQLHIIGGGSRNSLLNQLTANITCLPVYAGPVEATAIGNILVQALAKGEIKDMQELKEIAVRSANPKLFMPAEL